VAILEAIDGLVTVAGHTLEGMAGWRYLLSQTYRKAVHIRWSKMSRLLVAGEVLTFLLSFVFLNLIVGGGLWLLLS
jgi:hypothetical protein